MLDKVTLTKIAGEFLDTAPENYIEPAAALSPELAGLRIYDAPLLAFGDAADPLFERLKHLSRPGFGPNGKQSAQKQTAFSRVSQLLCIWNNHPLKTFRRIYPV